MSTIRNLLSHVSFNGSQRAISLSALALVLLSFGPDVAPAIATPQQIYAPRDEVATTFSADHGIASPLVDETVGGVPLHIAPSVFTGAATVAVSLSVPAARGRAMPPLALSYYSHRGDGNLGIGWSLQAGSISRSLKTGLDFEARDFLLSLGTKTVELIEGNDGVFRDRFDTFRVEARQSNTADGHSMWVVRDAFGTTLSFGSTPLSRVQFAGDTPRISEWHLGGIL